MTSPPTDQGFRLLIEPAHGTDSLVFDADPEMLAVAAGVSSVALGPAGDPEILGAEGPAPTRSMFQLEPVEVERHPALLMLASRPSPVRVNGTPAPPLSLLEVGDVIQLGDVLLHVSWLRAPQVGPAAEHLVGKTCPVCRTPITASATVFVHEECGTALHLEPDENGLQCALLGDCASCGRPVSLDSGLSYRPGP
jgi:hypothetical protein